jgi:hypothetical protein
MAIESKTMDKCYPSIPMQKPKGSRSPPGRGAGQPQLRMDGLLPPSHRACQRLSLSAFSKAAPRADMDMCVPSFFDRPGQAVRGEG